MGDKGTAKRSTQKKSAEVKSSQKKPSTSKESPRHGRSSESRKTSRKKTERITSNNSNNNGERMSREQIVPGKSAETVTGSGAKPKGAGTHSRERKPRKSSMGNKANDDEEVMQDMQKEEDPITPSPDPTAGSSFVDPRSKWANEVVSHKVKVIIKPFIRNKGYKPSDIASTAFEANQVKNRYYDVICIDKTRVKLQERDENNDYIHANWITMPDKTRYICTQGPLSETLEDFWHMIMTEKCRVIVMLCDYHEQGNQKCEKYVSRTLDLRFGPYSVKNYQPQDKQISTGTGDEIAYSTWDCTNMDTGVTLTVHHFRCYKWLDHIAPLDPKPYITVLNKAKELAAAADNNVITVHCSAGVGRTGSFVGVDLALQRLKLSASQFDMIDVFKEMRQQRVQSVQSAVQWAFLHMCVVEVLLQENVIPRDEKVAEFTKDYVGTVKKLNKRLEENAKAKKENE